MKVTIDYRTNLTELPQGLLVIITEGGKRYIRLRLADGVYGPLNSDGTGPFVRQSNPTQQYAGYSLVTELVTVEPKR